LETVADIAEGSGPNTINRENDRRRIILQCNTAGRDLNGVVLDIQARLAPIQAELPPGYFLEYGGQFESQRQATRMIGFLSLVSLLGMFLALYTLFRSTNLALQVLAALPMAAIGSVAALVITGQSLTVASMVGFISLSGIASRNGILLIAHYLHLVRHEGEGFTPEMVERAGRERVAPMLMTALTAGIALVPLVLAAGEPGKEILYPVATVILGGLISSTLLDFFVHPALFLVLRLRSGRTRHAGGGTRRTGWRRVSERLNRSIGFHEQGAMTYDDGEDGCRRETCHEVDPVCVCREFQPQPDGGGLCPPARRGPDRSLERRIEAVGTGESQGRRGDEGVGLRPFHARLQGAGGVQWAGCGCRRDHGVRRRVPARPGR